jgi:hypothetical protein
MPSGSRSFFAALIVAASACGLVYDVDSITKDESCGTKNAKCCAGDVCGDRLKCVTETQSDAGADAGCECPAADGAAGTDAQSATSCPCESKVCRLCGGSGEPCCDHDECADDALTCSSGTCTGCGAEGEECCEDLAQPCRVGLKCETGTCHVDTSACGAQGQPCCAGSCDTGLACQAGVCQPPIVTDCGGLNEACCTNGGALCESNNLKCSNNVCIGCGTEGAPCCDNPQCSAGSLTCDAGGICRTCPWAGATCGGNTGSVCLGVGGGEQCQPCGGLGNYCCSGSVPEPCPNQLVCCNGTAADGCNSCSQLPCTCKVCCVRCGNWAAGSYEKIPAAIGSCDAAGIAWCNGKGGKAFAQFRNSCPP